MGTVHYQWWINQNYMHVMEVGTPMKSNKEFIDALKDYPKVRELFIVMLWKMKEVGHALSIDIV